MSDSIIALNKTLDSLDSLRNQSKQLEKVREMYKDVCFILDYSSSMYGRLSDGKSATEHLEDMVNKLKIPHKDCVSFSDVVKVGVGIDDMHRGGTPLDEALDYIFTHKNIYKSFVLISDGQPDSSKRAIESAKRLGKPISVVYTGNKDSHGEQFMETLALETKGTSVTVSEGTADLLSQTVVNLLIEKN